MNAHSRQACGCSSQNENCHASKETESKKTDADMPTFCAEFVPLQKLFEPLDQRNLRHRLFSYLTNCSWPNKNWVNNAKREKSLRVFKTIIPAIQDLWICLICGHVGCGRYKAGHSKDHWKESSHVYALELETQRVWDYVGDGYVHRLIQSKTDGKLVEVPPPATSSSRGHLPDACSG